MCNINKAYSDRIVSSNEFKKNPTAHVNDDHGTLLVLNKNKPAFYCIPVEEYEYIYERIKDAGVNIEELFEEFKKSQPDTK